MRFPYNRCIYLYVVCVEVFRGWGLNYIIGWHSRARLGVSGRFVVREHIFSVQKHFHFDPLFIVEVPGRFVFSKQMLYICMCVCNVLEYVAGGGAKRCNMNVLSPCFLLNNWSKEMPSLILYFRRLAKKVRTLVKRKASIYHRSL